MGEMLDEADVAPGDHHVATGMIDVAGRTRHRHPVGKTGDVQGRLQPFDPEADDVGLRPVSRRSRTYQSAASW